MKGELHFPALNSPKHQINKGVTSPKQDQGLGMAKPECASKSNRTSVGWLEDGCAQEMLNQFNRVRMIFSWKNVKLLLNQDVSNGVL